MPLPVYRLRRGLAAIAFLFIAVIAGVYLYARLRERNVLKEIPNKIGIDIKQTANGFQFSKSDGKRTLFTVEAGNLKQFKLDGSAELHHVSIVLYGRDSSRFDQIYGDDFSYDNHSGNVTGHGEVQIDLEANPAGRTGPDQTAPKELKNPIHLKTRDLVFNQNSGDAATEARVDFRTPQATGWAVGVQYAAKSNTLTLVSQVHVTMNGPDGAHIFATRGTFTRDPRVVILESPVMRRSSGVLQADQATLFLGPDNNIEHVLATGNVTAETKPAENKTSENKQNSAEPIRARADQGEMFLAGKQNLVQTATLTGNVHIERLGPQPMQGDAGRAIFDFAGRNELQKIHAMDGVRLTEQGSGTSTPEPTQSTATGSQNYDITAPIIDFFVAEGKRLDSAVTSGAAKITIAPSSSPTGIQTSDQRTVITAGRFDAKFSPTPEGSSRLTSVHGAPNARIVNVNPGIPNRVSTSQTLDAVFLAEGGIASITQQNNVVYDDGQTPDKRTQAWADKAVYTPADRILVLTGSPRVTDGAMLTTATKIRINRDTDDAFAEGDVKTAYNELKAQPNGALLASSSPIHVTAATMTAHNSPAVALYQGNARLWQDANLVEAPSIQFDRDRRFLTAQGTTTQPVSTVLVQAKLVQPDQNSPPQIRPDQPQQAPPKRTKDQSKATKTGAKTEEKADDTSRVTISAARLTYADTERLAHYEGNVVAKGTTFSVFANTMDAYLLPRTQTSGSQQLAGPGRLDHMLAKGSVIVQQPDRHATGQTLLYTASDDKFVLTGGPPCIFDAEQGKITGVSLTFFRSDDRVLVEGEASTPVVTQTRMRR